jgi:SAM-dependent methyltransferase
MQIPHWQLPPGVSHGTWEYTQRESIADDYDDYFACNSLFEFDEPLLAEEFATPGLVADLGCGTARALVPLVRGGHRGLAIDLSDNMLTIVEEKAADQDLDIKCLQANLVELTPDLVADGSVDYAMCMFSTLGMIRGHANRQRVLANAFRMLKPGGKFVVHVHNFWFNLHDPGGPWWVLQNLLQAAVQRDLEVGDRYFPYRGVPDMYLHVFRPRELRRLYTGAGFRIRRWVPLEVTRRHPLSRPWFLQSLRANGWIVVGEKPLG